MRQEDETYQEWAFEHYIEHEEALRKAVAFVLKTKNDYRLDEIMADVVLARIPGLLRTWDESGASVEHHVLRGIKWYVWKHLQAGDKRREQARYLTDIDMETQGNSEALPDALPMSNEFLASLKSELGPELYTILYLRFVDGQSVQVIAQHMGMSRGTIYSKIQLALAQAKEFLNAKGH